MPGPVVSVEPPVLFPRQHPVAITDSASITTHRVIVMLPSVLLDKVRWVGRSHVFFDHRRGTECACSARGETRTLPP